MASAAVNVFWTSWAELDEGKAQDCNPCFGGYTGEACQIQTIIT